MRFIHLSDLHLGKRLHDVSLLEDQKDILLKILNIIDEESPDAVIIAGDVYDKSVPSGEAVELFDDFLVKLASRHLKIFIISGNHDSPERLAFGNRIMDASGIYLSPVFKGAPKPVQLTDEWGRINIYLLPFIKPANVRTVYEDERIESYTDAVKCVIGKMDINEKERNVLITHQFITDSEQSGSEEMSVGGADNVDSSVFDGFDYVALGHIHRPQNVDSGNRRTHIRYCGTPLKYSFSEAGQDKSVTVVDIRDRGELEIRTVPLIPKRDLVELRGTYEELTNKSFYKDTSLQDDYVHVILTDEDDVPHAMDKLRTVYHNILKLSYDNQRTRHEASFDALENVEELLPRDIFRTFYEETNGFQMSEEQKRYMEALIEKEWGDKR